VTTIKNPPYRPPKYSDPAIFEQKCNEYFAKGGIFTFTGLCLHLGFCDKGTFCDYQQKELFRQSTARAKMIIENQREKDLVNGETKNVNGIKFSLTNNFGWKEKTEVEHSGLPELPQTIQVKII
jgi:hypothetical protein